MVYCFIPESEEGDDFKRLSASTLWFGAGKWDRFDLFKEASALSHISKILHQHFFWQVRKKNESRI